MEWYCTFENSKLWYVSVSFSCKIRFSPFSNSLHFLANPPVQRLKSLPRGISFSYWRVDIECAAPAGSFPDAQQDPVIQIANYVTINGKPNPIQWDFDKPFTIL